MGKDTVEIFLLVTSTSRKCQITDAPVVPKLRLPPLFVEMIAEKSVTFKFDKHAVSLLKCSILYAMGVENAALYTLDYHASTAQLVHMACSACLNQWNERFGHVFQEEIVQLWD